MTTLCVCAVFDAAVQAYNRPMFVVHTGAAVRGFADEVNRVAPDNTLNKHAEDYELHHLAMWDEETGKFQNINDDGVDVVLIRGKDAKAA